MPVSWARWIGRVGFRLPYNGTSCIAGYRRKEECFRVASAGRELLPIRAVGVPSMSISGRTRQRLVRLVPPP